MRWILVFIILYLIPIIVIFRNYKVFSRACIYACCYVVLATSIVITNMYISNIKRIEANLNQAYEKPSSYKESYVSTFESNSRKNDLKEIDYFKDDISSIESIALNPINKCMPYINNIENKPDDLYNIKKQVEKSMYMCERATELYGDMSIPGLSKEKYSKELKECSRYMKQAYELKSIAMQEVISAIESKDIDKISTAKMYLDKSYKKIDKYKHKINCLQREIEGK